MLLGVNANLNADGEADGHQVGLETCWVNEACWVNEIR